MNPFVIFALVFVAAVLLAIIIAVLLIKTLGRVQDNQELRRYDYNKIRQDEFGNYGENCVSVMLNKISSIYKAYVYNNFNFKDEDGFSSNIDHILICRGGVFVIETKANKGIVYGNADDDNWRVKKKEGLYLKTIENPIKQNQGHINHLRRMFVKYPPKMISVVIFPFATYNGYDSTDTVYDDIDSLYDFIVGKILNEKYSEQFVERINSQLTQIEEQYGITLDEHKKILKEKYNSYFQ